MAVIEAPAAARRRTRRKDARPTEIALAALPLFAERGYAATRLEDVAAAAGIGKGTIYLYFANKEALFRSVVEQRILPRLDFADAMLARHTGSAADLLRGIAAMAAEVVESDLTAIPKLVLTESGNFPSIARFYADAVVRRGMGLLSRIIALGVARGEFRPCEPETVLPLFLGPVLMLALWKHSLGRHTDIRFASRKVVEAHVETLLRGLAPQARP